MAWQGRRTRTNTNDACYFLWAGVVVGLGVYTSPHRLYVQVHLRAEALVGGPARRRDYRE